MRCGQQRCDQDKQDRLRQSLEVDGGCGEQGLDFPVLAAASGGSCHAVTGFCQSGRAFGPSAVAGMKPGFGLAPGEAFAAGAQHVDMERAHVHSDSLVLSNAFARAIAASREQVNI